MLAVGTVGTVVMVGRTLFHHRFFRLHDAASDRASRPRSALHPLKPCDARAHLHPDLRVGTSHRVARAPRMSHIPGMPTVR